MTTFKSINKWSRGYQALRNYARLFHRASYRKIEIQHYEKIPLGRPVIFAGNHQNALMDALPIVLLKTRLQTVFLARADIFRKKRMAQILRFMKIMPVFRIRDGASSLSRNEETFAETAGILIHNNMLGVMPEGNHSGKRRLRNLNKGIFRIGMLAQENWGDKKGVVIVPVGLEFASYSDFRSKLLVVIGDPIELNQYHANYTQNPVNTFNRMRSDLEVAMKKVMIHITTNDYYDTYLSVKSLYNQPMRKKLGIKGNRLYDKFNADKAIIEKLDTKLEKNPNVIQALNKSVINFGSLSKKLGLTTHQYKNKTYNPFLLIIKLSAFIIGLPLALFGLLNNIIPFKVFSLQKPKIKDPQFISSFRFGLNMIVFTIYYLFVMLPLVLIFIPGWYFKLVYLLSLPFTGIFAFDYFHELKSHFQQWKFLMLNILSNADHKEAKQLYTDIMQKMDTITA